MVGTKVDQDQGRHLTVPSIMTLRSIFKVKWRFSQMRTPIFDYGLKKSGKFHVKNYRWKNRFCDLGKVEN